jgi:hypothetical protein
MFTVSEAITFVLKSFTVLQAIFVVFALCAIECALGLAPFYLTTQLVHVGTAWIAMMYISSLLEKRDGMQASAKKAMFVPEWCQDRHEYHAQTTLLPEVDRQCIYHRSGSCCAMKVARKTDGCIVVIRSDGNVDWLYEYEVTDYRDRFMYHTSCKEIDQNNKMRAFTYAKIWIKEHLDIQQGRAMEQDFVAGRAYSNTSPARAKPK